jgi:WD40 repeat protein
VRHAQFSPDGRVLVTVSAAAGGGRPVGADDGKADEVRLWDVARGTSLGPPLPHAGPVPPLFSPDGGRLLVCDRRGARLWDMARNQAVAEPLAAEGTATDAVFSPDGRRLLTLTTDPPAARLWDAVTGKPLAPPLKYAGIGAVRFAGEVPRVLSNTASGRQPGEVRVWDAASGRSVLLPLGPPAQVQAALSPDGRQVLTSLSSDSPDGDPTFVAAQVWDAGTGRRIAGLSRSLPGTPVFFTPDRRRVLTFATPYAQSLGEAGVYDLATGAPLSFLRQYESGAGHQPVFSPDGGRVLLPAAGSAADRSGVRVWELATGQPGSVIPVRGEAQAAFSPDSRHVLSITGEKTVELWPAAEMPPGSRALKHDGYVTEAAFSPDGRQVLTVSATRAQVWDAASRQPVTPPLPSSAREGPPPWPPVGMGFGGALGAGGVLRFGGGVPAYGGPGTRRASFSQDGRRVVTVTGGNPSPFGFATPGPLQACGTWAPAGWLPRP